VSAVRKAAGPGIGITVTSASSADWMSDQAGSEMPGVPASEISAMSFPALSSSVSALTFLSEVWLW